MLIQTMPRNACPFARPVKPCGNLPWQEINWQSRCQRNAVTLPTAYDLERIFLKALKATPDQRRFVPPNPQVQYFIYQWLLIRPEMLLRFMSLTFNILASAEEYYRNVRILKS